MAVAASNLSLQDRLDRNVPPHNIEAEQGVLGSMLFDNEVIHDIIQWINHRSFYRPSHQEIFRAITALYEAGQAIDSVILKEELRKQGRLDDVGGPAYIAEILQNTVSAANAEYYAKIVREKALIRNLLHAATEILREAYDENKGSDELIAAAERKIFELISNRTVGDTVAIADVLAEAFDRIDDRVQRGVAIRGVPTGFTELDEMTSGLQDSELIIIAARPSIGKTSFAMNIAEHVACDEGEAVFVVSLEMSKLELAERLLCSRARVDGHKLRTGRLSERDLKLIMDGCEELRPAKLYIDDNAGRDMLQIAANARRLKLRHDIKLVVVDYLQLIEPENKRDSRQEQISQISRRLKGLARELKVPVVALSQLNRQAENREGHKPRLSDLRESGAIEQDADVVMLLHRDDAYDANNNPGVAEINIAKQRNGPTGLVRVAFLKNFTRFETLSTMEEPFSTEAF